MTRVEYLGKSYDDRTDWQAVVREILVLKLGPSWLRSDLDLPTAVSDFAAAFEGTPLEAQLGEAALHVIEKGTRDQRNVLWGLPFEAAPGALDRLVTLVEKDRARFADGRYLPGLLWRLLRRHPENARLLAIVRREALRPDADEWTKELAAANPGP